MPTQEIGRDLGYIMLFLFKQRIRLMRKYDCFQKIRLSGYCVPIGSGFFQI